MASPLLNALSAHQVRAAVVDLDHYRIHGGMAVETDYIISVSPVGTTSFASFKLSKTYSEFRTMSSHLIKVTEKAASELEREGSLPDDVVDALTLAESVSDLVNSQRTEYLGKVNFAYVKVLASQRTQILNEVLDMMIQHYPTHLQDSKVLRDVAVIMDTFFLTDHSEEDDDSLFLMTSLCKKGHNRHRSMGSDILDGVKHSWSPPTHKSGMNNEEKKSPDDDSSHVVPISRKSRRSIVVRAADEKQLEEAAANLVMEDNRTGSNKSSVPLSSSPPMGKHFNVPAWSTRVESNPYALGAVVVLTLVVLRVSKTITLSVDLDVSMLIIFASFCLGVHMPRPSQVGGAVTEKPTAPAVVPPPPTIPQPQPIAPRRSLARMSMMATKLGSDVDVAKAASIVAAEEFGEEEGTFGSPMPVYPEGAKLGEYNNCYSVPHHDVFQIRGKNYLVDRVKVPSGPYLFPVRGIDLFLTNDCPTNVGCISGMYGGRLREVPTFIINFVIPWGVLVFYSEIPDQFLPFLKAGYEPLFDKSTLPSLDGMTPGERTTCRFLMGSEDHKNKTLKIVPVVRKGPWVVKSVVGGKPALIGKALPMYYHYSPRDGDKAEYLEADLEVVASSATRRIASLCTSYTHSLTIDLGFVIQGNSEEELPEQMIMAARLNGIDPLSAPALPPMKNMYLHHGAPGLDENDNSTGTIQ